MVRCGFALQRGVVSYPAVGDAVVLPTNDQLHAIIEASGTDRRVKIGNSRVALDAPVTIDPDKLFGRHLGVFGNTGSGKSCTVAGLVRWAVEAASEESGIVNARFIILDPNGEYRTCFKDLDRQTQVKVFSVEPQSGETQLRIPAWMWNGHEWSGALNASPGTQRPILMQAIRQLRSAALAGGDARVPDERLLLSTQLRAFLEYLRGCRAEGVAALGNFVRFRAIHQNLQGMEDQLRILQNTLGADEQEFFDALESAIKASNDARRLRTDNYKGQDRINQFQDADIATVLEALELVLIYLPDAAITEGPSEDMPAPFDPYSLPRMIELLANLSPGNIQQHMAGLDLRVRTLLSDKRITPIIAPEDGGKPLNLWLKDFFGDAGQGRGQISSILPIVLVLEEAHNFVQREGPDADRSDSATRCRHTFEKIAKEGRKFGVGLVLSSQRPAELAPTMVAQCNSFILHRIVNDRDQELVCRLAPDSTGPLLKELPSLPTQRAILIGIAAEIPLVFDVRPLSTEQRPSSAHPDFWDVWTQKRDLDLDLDDLSSGWSD